MAATDQQLRIGSTEKIQRTVVDEDGAAVSGAAVTVTYRTGKSETSAEVGGETWPKTLTETATAGTYEATLSKDMVLTEGSFVWEHGTAVKAGTTISWIVRRQVVVDDD